MNDKLRLYFEHNGNNKWVWILPNILNDYSEIHIHRTIGRPPALVSKENEQKIHNCMYGSYFELGNPKFKAGDRIRITKYKTTFGNKLENRWRKEIFIISNIHYTDPITYYVQDLNVEEIVGKFYKQELQKTKF